MLFMLLFSTGMWSASTGALLVGYTATSSELTHRRLCFINQAFLPSTFAMYTTLLASSYFLETPSKLNSRRTLFTTIFFAMGAIVGWPFSLLLAFPFVLEELFVFGGDRVKPDDFGKWIVGRWIRLFAAGAAAALFFVSYSLISDAKYRGLTGCRCPWSVSTPLRTVAYQSFRGTSSNTISLAAPNEVPISTEHPRGTSTS
jgi:alpha-1,2-mannosyltransferase